MCLVFGVGRWFDGLKCTCPESPHQYDNTNTQEAKTGVLDKALRHHEWARNEDNEEDARPRRMLFLDGAAV